MLLNPMAPTCESQENIFLTVYRYSYVGGQFLIDKKCRMNSKSTCILPEFLDTVLSLFYLHLIAVGREMQSFTKERILFPTCNILSADVVNFKYLCMYGMHLCIPEKKRVYRTDTLFEIPVVMKHLKGGGGRGEGQHCNPR